MTIHRDCADELLTTTRAVRKRLDLSRPVPRERILECIRISQQAPTASNSQHWRWLVVTDPAKKRALRDIYCGVSSSFFADAGRQAAAEGESQTARVYESAGYLVDHLHEVPALVIPCLVGRPPEALFVAAASYYGSIYPAVWSFCLAARARGLGTVLTTIHLMNEKQAAELLGIPDDVAQLGMIPVAYTIGDEFKPAQRPPVETITSFDQWSLS
jgi:nitroreductase